MTDTYSSLQFTPLTRKYINIIDFNKNWKMNNQNQYIHWSEIFSDEVRKLLEKPELKIEAPILNDVVFLYIKCCDDDDDTNESAPIWNQCLKTYLVNKLKNKVDLNNNAIIITKVDLQKTNLQKRHINQENIVKNLYNKILRNSDYDLGSIVAFIKDLTEGLHVFNKQILTYFSEFIQKYFIGKLNSLPDRYELIPDDTVHYNNVNDVENWAIFIDLTSIVLKNIKNNRYGNDIYILKEIPNITGNGGKKISKLRKSRKSKKSRKYKTRRFRKSNKHGR